MIAALPLSVSAAGEYVPGNPRWSGYQNQVQWGRPAGAASGDSFEYEAQLLLGDDVVESKAVEIDTYLFFTNDVVTRPQEEYTIRVRARWIMIVGDPDGQYMVADVGEAEPPHEHSYTQKHDAAQHWQECSCGERLNVANQMVQRSQAVEGGRVKTLPNAGQLHPESPIKENVLQSINLLCTVIAVTTVRNPAGFEQADLVVPAQSTGGYPGQARQLVN